MDMRKYSAGVIRPEDLYDGPRVEKIINIFEHEKHGCPVLEFESGDQFFCWSNQARVLNKAWGYSSDDWLGKEVELSLGHYTDKKTDPPMKKETIAVKVISPAKATAGNNGGSLPAPRERDMDDAIPF